MSAQIRVGNDKEANTLWFPSKKKTLWFDYSYIFERSLGGDLRIRNERK
jgi:hypothetical protein